MIRKIAMAALVLQFSAGLFPLSCFAIEEDRSIRIGRVGDVAEAYVNITSSEDRMSAAPRIRIRENREINLRSAGNGKEKESRSLTKLLPKDGISYSSGVKLIKQAREAIRKRKQEKADAAKISRPAADTDDAIDGSGHSKAAIGLCNSCDFRLVSEGTVRQ